MAAGAAIVHAVLLIAAVQSAPVQPSPPPTGLILGRVVDAASGRPVSGALVTLGGFAPAPAGTGIPAPPSQPRAMTNANGQFVFRNLPKGTFSLNVTRPGYLEGAYGRRRPGGASSTVQLDDGQRVGDVVVRLWRQAAISGTVTDETGEPLVNVSIRAFRRSFVAGRRKYLPAGSVSTDDRGIYRFNALSPGDYMVAFVSREVTVPAALDDMRSAANPGDKTVQAILRAQMSVGAMGLSASAGDGVKIGDTVRQIPSSAPVPPMPAESNAPTYVYPTVFFPDAPGAARAAVITVDSGQERGGVDLSLHPVRAARVSGTIVGPDGPVPMIAMRLVPTGDDTTTEIETSATLADGNGNFTFMGAIAGQYVIKVAHTPQPPRPASDNLVTTQVQVGGSMTMTSVSNNPAPAPIPDDPSLFASVTVGVADKDINGVIVNLQRGGRLTGRLEFEGTLDRPDPTTLNRTPITLERADGSSAFSGFVFGTGYAPPGRVDETGAFKTYGQAPGRYLVSIGGAPPGWTLKSVSVEGRDISDTPFDIGAADINNVVVTFTDRPTKLTGVARTKDGNPDPDALVVVFPADATGWSNFGVNPRRMRSTRAQKDGTYTIAGLPAGDYNVTAIAEDNVAQWQDPQLLAALARSATTVRLSEGDTRTQNLVRSGSDR